MSKPKLGFIMFSEAWYGKNRPFRDGDFVDEIMFGMYHEDGSTSGEMMMRWIQLNNHKVAPRLEVFDDAWGVLAQLTNVIAQLGTLKNANITPKQFAEVLIKHGFIDMTPLENPYTKG